MCATGRSEDSRGNTDPAAFTPFRPPDGLAQDIEQHARDVELYLKGELTASVLKSRRVPRGMYEQRQNGAYMVRVRVPGGALDAAQGRALAGVASRYGTGTLHVTTRQDVQIHGLSIEDTPAVLRELLAAGLTSKGGGGNTVRNVTACPYAGLCPAERFDVEPCVAAVTEHLLGRVGSYHLPRKYKISFSGCPADCALATATDLGFVAHARDGVAGFALYAGGGMGADSRLGDRLTDWLPATEAIRAAEAVRRLFDRHGDRQNRRRARLRFAVTRIGIDAFRREWNAALRDVAADGTPACAAPPLATAPAASPRSPQTLLTDLQGVRALRQRQAGYAAVPIPLPVGEIRWQKLDALSLLAERYSARRGLRTTQAQGLLIPFVREADLADLRGALESALGPAALAPAPLDAFTACTGAATCRLGLCRSQDAARACADAIARSGLAATEWRDIDIRVNGCPNACGQHPIGAIGLFGAAQREGQRLYPAYRVLLGGRRGEGAARFGEPIGAVPARSLPAFLVELLRAFQAGRRPGESFTAYVDREGLAPFRALAQRHAAAPDPDTTPAFYCDWGSGDAFSLAGRGAGECSAGVFQLIAEDLAAATLALKTAEAEAGAHDALLAALLAAARALLVTRGVDSRDARTILAAFAAHFVDTGLVMTGTRALLDQGRAYVDGHREALDGREHEIRGLLERVERLYASMDADLRFHAPAADA